MINWRFLFTVSRQWTSCISNKHIVGNFITGTRCFETYLRISLYERNITGLTPTCTSTPSPVNTPPPHTHTHTHIHKHTHPTPPHPHLQHDRHHDIRFFQGGASVADLCVSVVIYKMNCFITEYYSFSASRRSWHFLGIYTDICLCVSELGFASRKHAYVILTPLNPTFI